MSLSISTIVLILASFAVTFTAARILGRGIRKRRAERAQVDALKGQSRQVRRAHVRKTR